VTLRLRRDVPSLRTHRLVREVERSLRVSCERGRFRVVHYSLQRDHVHLLVEAENALALGSGMQSIGARIARHAAQRGVRAPAVIDAASSGRCFLGWTHAHAPPPERAPVAKARSWLLRVGWWGHGRIDPREVPGARR
jgi:REP element-mobilizing transposase RayT